MGKIRKESVAVPYWKAFPMETWRVRKNHSLLRFSSISLLTIIVKCLLEAKMYIFQDLHFHTWKRFFYLMLWERKLLEYLWLFLLPLAPQFFPKGRQVTYLIGIFKSENGTSLVSPPLAFSSGSAGVRRCLSWKQMSIYALWEGLRLPSLLRTW